MSEPKRYALVGNPWEMVEQKNGNLVSYEDYARLKKQYDDLEYCQGHVPYAQHRSAVDKWTELFHKTADNFDKVVAENARLKAEVERLSRPAIVGGYNLSEYIRMANSETLEFDNGDIFADMTLPERIKYIVESHARLNAEVERSRDQYNGIIDTQLAVIDRLKAQVERLTKAGDAMAKLLSCCGNPQSEVRGWHAAKEGKQP